MLWFRHRTTAFAKENTSSNRNRTTLLRLDKEEAQLSTFGSIARPSCHFLLRFAREPGNGLARPHAGGIRGSKFLGDFAQHRVVVRCLIVRYCSPVQCARCRMGMPKSGHDAVIPALSICILLLHESDST